MLINEVCKECSLTKKAVEYYVEQGLVKPTALENGYRDFSVEDTDRLKKTAVLRNLGLPVSDIQKILAEQTENAWYAALNEISRRKALEITILGEKHKLIAELAENHDWETVSDKLRQLQRKQTVLERLQNAFPGYYGNYVCQHFAPYLDEPVTTGGQQEAFETILAFLDSVSLEFPEDLREYYNEMAWDMGGQGFGNAPARIEAAVCDIEKFMDENREVIENYMEYRQSAEYRDSIAYRIAETLRQFNNTSGYDDIFIPAMRRLSKSYCAYYETLQKANEKFLQRYPQSGRADGYENG